METDKRKWWLKRSTLICGAVAAVVLVVAMLILFRWRSNVALARELRVEIDAWLQTLPQIPDSENGMLPVLAGLKAFKDDLPERLNARDFSVENESDKTLLKQYLAEKEHALRQIYKGLGYKELMFPYDHRKRGVQEVPSLSRFCGAARTLELKGNLLESEGKKSEAFNEYLNAFRLSEALSEERTLVSRMVESVILYIALEPLTRALSESSVGEEEVGSAVQILIELYAKRGNYFRTTEAGYYYYLILIADMIEGKGDFAGSAAKYFHNFRYDVQVYRKANEIFRRIDPAKYYTFPPEAESKETFLEAIGAHRGKVRIIGMGLFPLCERVERLAVTETLWRGAIALAAIRLFEAQNGRFPKNLAELGGLVPKELLTDPFSGNEIVYRLEGNDFYLYSVGIDGVDGNAASGLPYFREKSSVCDLPDIIFHAPAPAPK